MTDTTETSAAPRADDGHVQNDVILFVAPRRIVEYDTCDDPEQIESIDAWNAGNKKNRVAIRYQYPAQRRRP